MKIVKKSLIFLSLVLLVFVCGCKKEKTYTLNEDTFFLVMTNIIYYPEQYDGSEIEYDCFTYKLTDVNEESYMCGVRKCSSGYGCTCGKDTIIGFVLESNDNLPEPRNQSTDDGDKTWVHLKGKLKNSNKKTITIYAYNEDGTINKNQTEQIIFLVFVVENWSLIEDSSNLNYYVTK
jgi:hypothetical protein